MGHRQEDVERGRRQSGNSGRSSFHLFVCSQAVFAPVKTKFNLHPFIHCYSLLSASASPQPKPLSCSPLPSHLLFPSPRSYPPASPPSLHPLNVLKKYLSISLCRPKAVVFWLSSESPFYISMCNDLKDYWQTHVLGFTQTHVLWGWQVRRGRGPQMERVKGQSVQIMSGFVMREALARTTSRSVSEGDVFSILPQECVETLESWSGCTKLWKPGWFGSERLRGSFGWNEPKATIQRYLSSLFTRCAWGPSQY